MGNITINNLLHRITFLFYIYIGTLIHHLGIYILNLHLMVIMMDLHGTSVQTCHSNLDNILGIFQVKDNNNFLLRFKIALDTENWTQIV